MSTVPALADLANGMHQQAPPVPQTTHNLTVSKNEICLTTSPEEVDAMLVRESLPTDRETRHFVAVTTLLQLTKILPDSVGQLTQYYYSKSLRTVSELELVFTWLEG